MRFLSRCSTNTQINSISSKQIQLATKRIFLMPHFYGKKMRSFRLFLFFNVYFFSMFMLRFSNRKPQIEINLKKRRRRITVSHLFNKLWIEIFNFKSKYSSLKIVGNSNEDLIYFEISIISGINLRYQSQIPGDIKSKGFYCSSA